MRGKGWGWQTSLCLIENPGEKYSGSKKRQAFFSFFLTRVTKTCKISLEENEEVDKTIEVDSDFTPPGKKKKKSKATAVRFQPHTSDDYSLKVRCYVTILYNTSETCPCCK